MELQYKLPRTGIGDSTRRVQLRGLHSVAHVVVMGCLRVLLLGWGVVARQLYGKPYSEL